MNEPIVRSLPFEVTRTTDDSDGLTLEGIAATFNDPTRIDNSWEGTFDEQIARGAFDKSINDRAQWPVMMFQHGRHPVIGNMPIGVITTLRAQERGLFVRARLTDNWLISPVRDAIAAGALKGMSFRAEPVNHNIDRSTDPPLVTRTELKLFELGPVVAAAYENTKVTVRSKAISDALDDPDALGDLAMALLTRQSDEDDANLDVADAGKLNAAGRRIAARRGWAMSDGSYPIRPLEMHGKSDLDKAVNAVGRGSGSHDAIRRHIIKRARALDLSEMIPENWASDGSLKETSRSSDAPPDGHADEVNGRPPEGHPSPPENPPIGDNVIRAQMERIETLVGIAERSSLR